MLGVVKLSALAGDAALEQVPEPEPGVGEVKVQIHRAGICGTDLKVWRGLYNPAGYRTPVVMGHEFSGRVVAVGEGVQSIRLGDPVTAQPTFQTCGRCDYCRTGRANLCSERLRLGFDVNGAFADFLVAPADSVYRLPESINLRQAALLEPLAVATRAVTVHSAIRAGDRVAVIGPGTIGLLVTLVAQSQGARATVVGLPQDRARLELASRLGASVATVGAADAVGSATSALRGDADVVLECSGSEGGVALGLNLARPGGRYVQVGTASHDVKVPFMRLAYRELQVTGSFAHVRSDWERSIDLLASGQIDPQPLITHELPFSRWEDGMHKTEQGQAVKVLLIPPASAD